jgi:uncharacterized protein (DUF2132 family)
MSDPSAAHPDVARQPDNPLHGVTLEAIVTALAEHYGWEDLGQRIAIRCFISDPSVASSLKFTTSRRLGPKCARVKLKHLLRMPS